MWMQNHKNTWDEAERYLNRINLFLDVAKVFFFQTSKVNKVCLSSRLLCLVKDKRRQEERESYLSHTIRFWWVKGVDSMMVCCWRRREVLFLEKPSGNFVGMRVERVHKSLSVLFQVGSLNKSLFSPSSSSILRRCQNREEESIENWF